MPETPTIEITVHVQGDPHSSNLPSCVGVFKARSATTYQVGVCFGMMQQWIERNAKLCCEQLDIANEGEDTIDEFNAGFEHGRNEADTEITGTFVASKSNKGRS